LVLLTSGQAMGANYYSTGNISGANPFGTLSNWLTDACSSSGGTTTATTTPSQTSSDVFSICDNHSLTLSTSNIVSFWVLRFGTTGTSFSGVLKFSSGSKVIGNRNTTFPSIALNVSSMTSGDNIYIEGGSPSEKSVIFSSVTGGSLSCATSYPATISKDTICTVTVTPIIPIPAPIGLHFSKQVETFATEIELK
jgi:hypothetical protein